MVLVSGGAKMKNKSKKCKVSGCYEDACKLGYCGMHYWRLWKYGDVDFVSRQTHGMRYHSLYNIWRDMKNRCYNSKNSYYHCYGGRGIKVCERWMDIHNFIKDMGKRPPGMQIDRIDNDGDYTPENCKWSSIPEQARNTRRNKLTMGLARAIRKLRTTKGLSYAKLAKMFGVCDTTIRWVIIHKTWKEGVV